MATLKELGIIELEMRIGLDTYHPKVRVTQYDSGLTLEYDIVDRNGEVVTSLPDVVPMLYVEAPDKSAIGSAEGTITGGKAIIPIPSSLLSKFGEAEAQVQLVNAETKEQIHDNTFVLDIAQSKMDGEVSPGESIWFNLQDLKEAIASVKQLEEQYDTDVTAVATMREDVTTKHGEVTTMHSSLQDVFDTESARVLAEKARVDAEKLRASAETTRANNETKRATAETNRITAEDARAAAEAQRGTDEDTRLANETVRETNESVRETQETTRETQEGARQTLYEQLKTLQEVLGTDPAVELAQAVTALQDADLEILEAGRATAHLTDPAKDLITEGGTLYRLTHVIEDGTPWLRHVEVGKVILNDGMELTAPGDAPRMRLYWKAQGEANAYIAAWAGEEQENRYVGEVDSYTRQYSAVFDLSSTRTVTLSTLTAWGQKVKIWDMDWRVEA